MRDHKSLIAWQRSHTVVCAVLRASVKHWKPSAQAVFSQLQRASLSVQLNIAEGHARKTPALFRNHLRIAYGSAVETVELLELALEAGILPDMPTRETLSYVIETRALLLGLLRRFSGIS